MFTQFKAYIYGVIAIIVALLSTGVWIQTSRINSLKSDIAQSRLNTEACIAANVDGQKTINELKKERERAGKSCAKQIAEKNKLIDELRKIDETRGGNNGTRTSGNGMAGSDSYSSGNALLDLLNGMLPAEGGGQDGVCKAGDPGVARGTEMVSRDVLYCLDEVNAKNLAKDWALCKAWALDGVNVIEGMR